MCLYDNHRYTCGCQINRFLDRCSMAFPHPGACTQITINDHSFFPSACPACNEHSLIEILIERQNELAFLVRDNEALREHLTYTHDEHERKRAGAVPITAPPVAPKKPLRRKNGNHSPPWARNKSSGQNTTGKGGRSPVRDDVREEEKAFSQQFPVEGQSLPLHKGDGKGKEMA